MFGKKANGTALAPRPENASTGMSGMAGLTRWTPRDELSDIRRQMDDLFARAFGYTPLPQFVAGGSSFAFDSFEPPVDIYTSDDKVFVYAALPGFAPEQIDVEATAETITIQGERKAFPGADKTVVEQQSGVTGESRFRIQCSLPAEIDPNKATSRFRNGILELEMPKTEQARSKGVKVAINTAP